MEPCFEIIRWDDDQEEFISSGAYINTPHIASVLIEEEVFTDEATLYQAIQHTFRICMQLGIPIHHHFKRLHVHGPGGHIQEDWALSNLACYLLILNGDILNPCVAQAQAYAIRKAFS